MKIVIEAGAEVTLKAGGSFVKVDPSGVTVSGPLVRMNSGGGPGSGRGVGAVNPELPSTLSENADDSSDPDTLASSDTRSSVASGHWAVEGIIGVVPPASAFEKASDKGVLLVSGCALGDDGKCKVHDHG